MKTPKKILIFGGIFLALVVLALYVLLNNKPIRVDKNVLNAADVDKLVKISVQQPTQMLVLEKKSGKWGLTSPVEDEADLENVDQLVSTLKNLTVGSVMSEKKERYPTFEVDDAKATRLKVFKEGQEKPILDAFVGKQAVTYGSSFLRFADRPQVYIANNLSSWNLMRSVNDFRMHRLVPYSKSTLTKITFETASSKVTLLKSSHTWTREGSTTTIQNPAIAALVDRVDGWKSYEFLDQLDPKTNTQFNKPVLTLTASDTATTKKIVIGAKKMVMKGQPDPNQRYVQVEGRKTILGVGTALVDDVLTQLKTLPK